MRNYLIIILFFINLVFGISQTRSFSFQHYGPEDGLNNANVFAIKQDKNSILYLATENGVYDFDGYNFSKIKPVSPLKSNRIRSIAFDANNQLLIINRNEGIYSYTKKTNDIKLVPQFKFKTSVDEFIYTQKYSYALSEPISLAVIDNQTGIIIDDEIFKTNNLNQSYCIYKTIDNIVLIGRSDGLYKFENGHQLKINLPKSFAVYSITQNAQGLIYLGSDNGIVVLNNYKIEKNIVVKVKQEHQFFGENNLARVSKLVVDKFNRIWFTTNPDDNLYLIENNNTYDAFDLLGIDKVLINCIFKDNDDHIWIGTANDGVYFIQNPKVQNISFTSGRKILPITCAYFIDKSIVAGTNNGLFIYDYEHTNTQTVVAPDNLFLENIYGIHQFKNNVMYSKSSSIENTKRSYLINTTSYQFTPIATRLFAYCQNPNEAYVSDITASLYKVTNYTKEAYKIIDTIVSYPDYRTRINTLYSNASTIFIGTSDGLTTYDIKNKSSQNYKNSLFNFSINHIEHHNNKTYIAHDNGITVFEDTSLIQQIGVQQLTAVKKIKFYQNYIWIATLDGLFICDLNFNPLVIYNKSNGLLSNTINDIVFSGNKCCICSDKGITLCDISDLIKTNINANKLFITAIEVDEKKIDWQDNTLQLTASQNDLIINFSSPLFVKPNKQFFKYKLNKGKWQNLDNTQVHLSSINGGKQTIQICSSYDNINWSEPISITIKKEIPFKNTIWFALSIALSSLVIMGVSGYWWLRKIKIKTTKRVQEERQVNLLKHQAMNSLMSPHFIFNSLTSIQNYINLNDSLKASEYLAKFSRLIRMIIEKASQSEIVLHEELTRLNYYLDLEKERFKGKFDFFIHVEENVNTLEIKIPNMIIQPYAENSIIHGILPKHEHGNLHITFKKDGTKTLLILIEDDGIGFNKAKENAKAGHKSLGTRTIENILELNTKLTGKNQSVEIIDKMDLPEQQQGTRITITLQID